MTERAGQPESGGGPRWYRQAVVELGFLTAAVLAAMVLSYYYYYPSEAGVVQPLPFSHRFHAGEKKIGCLLCHADAQDSPRAGVPPLETCMLCHKRIIVNYPKIEQLTKYYNENRPVAWQRVNAVPEFVYFDHSVHLHKGFDCGRCHGDVSSMDRVVPRPVITMGFCVDCHRAEGASHDCYMCHR